jgi:hypothetical protein
LKNRVSDSVEEVSLSKSYTTINEKRVVALTWLLSYPHRSRVAELVAVSNHEILEAVARIDIIENPPLDRGLGRVR